MIKQRSKIIGLHEVEWREAGEELTNEPHWYRNKTCPVAGELRWVNIRQRHQTAIGERVWLLFQPGLSSWDEYPDKLDEAVIVECELVQIADDEIPVSETSYWKLEDDGQLVATHPEIVELARQFKPRTSTKKQPAEQYKGWVKVECHRVIGLGDIPNCFPQTQSNDIYADDGSLGDYRGETSKLLYLTRQYQEAAHWWVITKTTPARLVLACFDIYDSPFEICNFVVPRSETADRPMTLVDTIRDDLKDTATKEILHYIGEWPM